jgi:hypothetical protein
MHKHTPHIHIHTHTWKPDRYDWVFKNCIACHCRWRLRRSTLRNDKTIILSNRFVIVIYNLSSVIKTVRRSDFVQHSTRLRNCSLRFSVSEQHLMALPCLSVFRFFHPVVATVTLNHTVATKTSITLLLKVLGHHCCLGYHSCMVAQLTLSPVMNLDSTFGIFVYSEDYTFSILFFLVIFRDVVQLYNSCIVPQFV